MQQNDPFYLWKQYAFNQKQENEINRNKTITNVCDALRRLSKKYDWDQLYIFGSLIKKDAFTNYSDIDIGISGLNKFDHFSFVADLSGIVGRDVDVELLEDSDFSDKILKSGMQWKK